jgi:hypothetical protein
MNGRIRQVLAAWDGPTHHLTDRQRFDNTRQSRRGRAPHLH